MEQLKNRPGNFAFINGVEFSWPYQLEKDSINGLEIFKYM
jgi:hypothetical protein